VNRRPATIPPTRPAPGATRRSPSGRANSRAAAPGTAGSGPAQRTGQRAPSTSAVSAETTRASTSLARPMNDATKALAGLA
jgi:hypothetical protein